MNFSTFTRQELSETYILHSARDTCIRLILFLPATPHLKKESIDLFFPALNWLDNGRKLLIPIMLHADASGRNP